MLAHSLILLLTLLPAAASSQGSLGGATASSTPGACSAGGDGSSSCPVAARDEEHRRTLRDIEAYVALLEGRLEERLAKHEQRQWEQQRNLFVLLAVSICLAVVFIVALAACKVYVQSLQNQIQSSLQAEELRGLQDSPVAGRQTPCGGGVPQKQPLPREQSKLSSVAVEERHQEDRWCNNWRSEETHPTAANELAFDDDLGDDPGLCLYPSGEDVGELPSFIITLQSCGWSKRSSSISSIGCRSVIDSRRLCEAVYSKCAVCAAAAEKARTVEEVRAATGLSPELQQQQEQLEARCSRLFERLHEITDASRAFCSSSSDSEEELATDPAGVDEVQGEKAAADAPPEDSVTLHKAGKPQNGRQRKKRRNAADPSRLEEQRELLQQLQQLFHEIDATFVRNKPAHVSVMIRCCNALLRADGLAVLKACADCEPLHKEAQSIIEIVVPCIWAT
ncbi:hypothetical protein, conserved [Eimeria acervulina]|uniref:Transmembrane protein n=1 Tax=Eimeria acervulina TaxID=5801 RepID=U6GGS2_EIMAC|nr:hypothetical protein, conserved [Eimeria acervulina]CDI78483.1 hypothetical protein, conserved [Eimeria acervulina]